MQNYQGNFFAGFIPIINRKPKKILGNMALQKTLEYYENMNVMSGNATE